MRKRGCRSIAAIALSLSMLTGCGSQITHGKVIAKDFTPAHSRVVMVPVVHSTGKSTFTTLHPFVYHYEDEWEITIQGFAADSSEMQTAVYSVSEEVYDAIELGDEFTWTEEMEQN